MRGLFGGWLGAAQPQHPIGWWICPAVENSTELNQVLKDSIARVKVVRGINCCGGPGTGIIGCAWAPGNGMAVVRTSDLGTEAVLWIHEFGHDTGLGHDGGPLHIMGATDSG